MFGIYKLKRLRTHVIPTALESVTSLGQTTMNSVKAFKSRQDKPCKSGLLKQLNINSLSMATKQTTRKQIILPTYELCLRELSLDQCDQIRLFLKGLGETFSYKSIQFLENYWILCISSSGHAGLDKNF